MLAFQLTFLSLLDLNPEILPENAIKQLYGRGCASGDGMRSRIAVADKLGSLRFALQWVQSSRLIDARSILSKDFYVPLEAAIFRRWPETLSSSRTLHP